MSLHARPKPLNERQELVVRLRDEEKLKYAEIARQMGVGESWVRIIHTDARKRLADFARHGEDSLLLLPGPARKLLKFYKIENRAEFRAAIESERLRMHSQCHAVSFEKHPARSCRRDTWAALHEWAGLPVPEKGLRVEG